MESSKPSGPTPEMHRKVRSSTNLGPDTGKCKPFKEHKDSSEDKTRSDCQDDDDGVKNGNGTELKFHLEEIRIEDENRNNSEAHKSQLRCEVEDIQPRVEDGSASIDDFQKRAHLIKKIIDIKHVENLNVTQKAKVKSAIEGDENSSYFHTSINRKRMQAAIREVIKDGVWIVELNDVKAEFKDHFWSRFSMDGGVWLTILSDTFLKLSTNQITSLDAPFSCEEIKKYVWDCSLDKAPDLDGFALGFFKRFWEVIKEDVFALVRSFQKRRDIPRRCNPSFIALILKGDPLSPLLFVLVMEGFHVGILEAYRAGVFQGVSIGSVNIQISHPLYADDAIILFRLPFTYWGIPVGYNMNRINSWKPMIDKFNKKLSSLKDKLLSRCIIQMLWMIGCCAVRLPFTYLGILMGCNMNRIDSWKLMIDKFNKKLSSCKAKLLSIGGRLTLLKSIMGSMNIYYMSIYKVPTMVIKMLESLRAHFFWDSDLGDMKLP
ncbi:hypothetical protein Tco_0352737 [Tanacetum coccineum]